MFAKDKNKLFDILTDPPSPWTNRKIISAAGIIANGWTKDNKIFLLSADGYSISNPTSGEIEIRNHDESNTAMTKFSTDNLEFTVDELKQTIKIFGLRGGNGNHLTSDGWALDSFHPALGEQIVGIKNLKSRSDQKEYWQTFTLINLVRLEHFTLTYGFSPNEKHFAIFGSGGAEVFTRQ
ncbi:MAG: hypothetical protein JNM51_11020 [Bacteroidia bacterium]|nr:hypothetical protein [Bacteroidia bacterium]